MAKLLMQGAMDVSTLARGLTQDISVISRHCQTLCDAGVISRTKEGRNVIYSPNAEVVEKLKHFTAQIEKLLPKK